MNIWDPFHPVAYFLHAILGIAGIIGAIAALSLAKGTRFHILAGRIFAIAAAVAASTAIGFSFTNFAPMAIASAGLMFSVVGSALLAHRDKSPWVSSGESATATLMALVLLWLIYGVVMAIRPGGLFWIPPLVLALLTAVFLVNDIRFIRLGNDASRSMRLRRHLSRMAFAFAIAVHEPIVVFSDRLNIHPSVAFYGPLLVWPAIFLYFRGRLGELQVAMPNE